MPSFDVERARAAGMSMSEIQAFMQSKGLQPKKTIGGFVSNVGSSTGNLIGNTVSGIVNIANPNMEQNTVAQLAKLAMGIMDKVMPGEQGNEQYADALINYFKDRYGSLENIKNTVYQDPAGFAADVSSVLMAGGGLVAKAGQVGKMSTLANTGSKVAKFGSMVDPVMGSAQLAGKGMGRMSEGIAKVGQSMEESGKAFLKRGYGQNQKIAKFEKQFRPVQDVINEYGVYGKNTEKLQESIDSIQQMFDDIAVRSGRSISDTDLMGIIANKIDELRKSGFTEDGLIADQIEKKTMELINSGKLNKNNPVDVLTELRKGFDKRTKTFATDPTAKGANQQMRDVLQGTVRDITGDITSPNGENVKQLGMRLNELRTFQPILEQAAQRGKTSRPLSLGRVAVAGVGAAAKGVPGAIAGLAVDSLANSPLADKMVSQGMIGMGKSLQTSKVKLPTKQISNMYGTAKLFRPIEITSKTALAKSQSNQTTDGLSSKQPSIQPSLTSVKNQSRTMPYTPDYSDVFKKVKYTKK